MPNITMHRRDLPGIQTMGGWTMLSSALGKTQAGDAMVTDKKVEGRTGLRIEDKTCSWRIMEHGSTPSYY
jgi:hypothetical protein